jgi:heme A synthase
VTEEEVLGWAFIAWAAGFTLMLSFIDGVKKYEERNKKVKPKFTWVSAVIASLVWPTLLASIVGAAWARHMEDGFPRKSTPPNQAAD